MFLPYLFLSFCLSMVFPASGQKLEVTYEWKWIDYLWDKESDRDAAIKSGHYNKTKPIVIDVDTWKDGRVFVTIIRQDGVPASLTTVSDVYGDGGKLLMPYPDWSWTKLGDCDAITNVYRVAIDECDRLWVIDNGRIGGIPKCQPQLLAFDLNTNRLVKREKIPLDMATNPKTKEGLLITPIVETEGRWCEQTHVYIADVLGEGIVVFNGTTFWRLDSMVYGPQESAADAKIAGESFHLNDGVLGMALSPKISHGDTRYLMFRPFASYDMVSATTWNLHESYDHRPVKYTVVSPALPSQAVAMAFSSHGALFFGLTAETALACWNIGNPLNNENIVEVDHNLKTHQFVSGLKVIPKRITGKSEQIWMVTNRYQKIASGTQNFSEVNFRILTGNVEDLIADTNCYSSSGRNEENIHFPLPI